MKSLRFLDRRAGFSLASIGLLLGVVTPSLVPAFASAGTITTRSITMSSSATSAADTIEVKGTTTGAIGAGGGIVIQFCDDSPLINTSCDDSDTTVTSPTAGGTTTGTASRVTDSVVKWVATGAVGAGTDFDFTISGITNPTTVEPFYARMTTYSATPDYTDATHLGTVLDSGSVALSTTDTVGVTAAVLETMSFCVSGGTVDLTGDCGTASDSGNSISASGTSSPSMKLGQNNSGVIALDAQHLSTGNVYTQLSSNAATGVTVNLKSNASNCGGLFRNNDPANCDITPQDTTGSFTAGQAKFGLTVSDAADAPAATSPSGRLSISRGTNYSASDYFINYGGDDTTGVTSTYGSPLYQSTGPINNQDVKLTFGASISNSTPAGLYGADLSLIATGKF